MNKPLALTGIVGILAIVGIVFTVNSALSGMYVSLAQPYIDSYNVRPSGIPLVNENGLILLRHPQVINNVCKNAAFCDGQASYVCCNDLGTDCQTPSPADESRGSCPLARRGKCLCREDYLAYLEERYG